MNKSVYISSTCEDFKEEREKLITWLTDAHYQVRHSYRASPTPLVETCIRDVENSDIYILLQGMRYGHQPECNNPDRLSITHLEYRAARAAKKYA